MKEKYKWMIAIFIILVFALIAFLIHYYRNKNKEKTNYDSILGKWNVMIGDLKIRNMTIEKDDDGYTLLENKDNYLLYQLEDTNYIILDIKSDDEICAITFSSEGQVKIDNVFDNIYPVSILHLVRNENKQHTCELTNKQLDPKYLEQIKKQLDNKLSAELGLRKIMNEYNISENQIGTLDPMMIASAGNGTQLKETNLKLSFN